MSSEAGSGVQDLKTRLDLANKRIAELEEINKQVQDKARVKVADLEAKLEAGHNVKAAAESQIELAPISEADVTLRRLVQRIAMILQAEKIVIMFYDRERTELIGMAPAYGVDEDRLPMFRVRATQGISGQVFREGQPAMFHDAQTDPRTDKDMLSIINARNGITVPLVIEKRDEENRVTDRTTIGVLHAFNKRHNEDFNDEDVRLLERMSRNVGSIIANQQLYREVLEEREELLQTFESLTAGLVLVSPENRISQMNASARAIFGAPMEVVGMDADEVLTIEELRNQIDSARKGDEAAKLEFAAHIGGVERIYEVQCAQVRNEDGKDLGVVAIFMDITEIRNIDRMKSSFVAMASHELRTPLTAIKGFVSTLLMDDGFGVDERREFHMIIDQECDRLTRLINDLLNTARIEADESLKPFYEMINPRLLLEKCVMIQKQSSTRHQVVLDAPAELPHLMADQDKLDQVVTNLLSNAIKYSPNGGKVTVHAKVEDDWLLVGVEDEGMGIPKEHLGRVFEKFHRVHNEDNRKIYGTGLGLFLVKHLIDEVHLGKIWAESEEGVGSTFWFRIPLHLDIEAANARNS